jgi:type IV pilus assembly protein PilY1
MKTKLRNLAATVCFLASAQAIAGAVLINSTDDLAIGVNDQGHLNTASGSVAVNVAGTTGLAFDYGTGFQDAISPGCECEGWGVSASGTSGYANVSSDGVVNLTLGNFTSTGTSITSKVSLTSLPGLSVTHVYSESANTDRLFLGKVTITNNTGDTLSDVRYVRVMDWDIPPTEFDENVSIQGTFTIFGTDTAVELERSHDGGFSTANPLGSDFAQDIATIDVDFIDNGPQDHGAYFRFNFGDLADGESIEFTIVYGAAAGESAMLNALSLEGVGIYSLGQQSAGAVDGLPATFAFGFKSFINGSITTPSCDMDAPGAIIGTPGNDTLLGTPGDDVIIGLGGNDTIFGFGGNDCIVGGEGNDKILGGPGNDLIIGDNGDDDLVTGNGGDDQIVGGTGNDHILGGAGDDAIDGGPGADQINGNSGDDEITGSGGDDSITGSSGDDFLDGGFGNDEITGNSGNDEIIGGIGDDSIVGSGGDDEIDGGAGNDNIDGGPGTDMCVDENGSPLSRCE